jgi:hypothetical protein
LTLETLWIYVAVPLALVSVLVLIRLKQEKNSRKVGKTPSSETRKEETRTSRKEVSVQSTARPDEAKPQNCPKFLGYLYLRKATDGSNILSECYNCPRLLQCLYTPNVMEKVYG